MTSVRKKLYDRLPEIYHIKDKEQKPPYQLKAYLDILDKIQDGVRDNIETLYHDFFIETCSDWVIPYIADLLGTSHLSGSPWTLRADVARTIKHRRRKGTLGAIESLTYGLTEWAVHTVELRERVVWDQHLNHQRPDKGGKPPIPLLIEKKKSIGGAVRGGTVTLRDPAILSLFNGPFCPFAHVVDVKPVAGGAIRYNIPNLAIFLWRLKDYTVPVTKPVLYYNAIIELTEIEVTDEVRARFVLCYDIHPLAEPMELFNAHRFKADDEPPNLTGMDAVPGPMPRARLSTAKLTGKPEASEEPKVPEEYVAIDFYSTALPDAPGDDAVGLTLHMPEIFKGRSWTFRGANLCAWEEGLAPVLRKYEIVIDPDHGRLLIGVGGDAQGDEAGPLHEGLFVSATYGFSGSSRGTTGAHPIVRVDTSTDAVKINYDTFPNGMALQKELVRAKMFDPKKPLVIEIEDSRIYTLDVEQVDGATNDGGWTLNLGRSVWIRAASGNRPIIKLKKPLGFRPVNVNDPGVEEMNVTLEGLYITWDHESGGYTSDGPLINRAAVNQLTIKNCTLDPGNHVALDGARQAIRDAFNLKNNYGLTGDELRDFNQTPQLIVERSICGPMAIDDGYNLTLIDSIVDAGSGVNDTSANLAIHATNDPETEWGPELTVSGMTCFGRMRVESATGQGGIWIHQLEVHDDQQGCIKFSYFSGDSDKLPQHQACVFGTKVILSFVSEIFGQAGYAQLHLRSDRKILMQGPDNDAMGAFGYLLNTHKWKNINIRYREFMPVGVRPVLVLVT